ncbi:MAG: hypothetical protein A2X25_04395 [Chloroflexi bacterium GWB2_49_20]|nr:MAG: hypothetical protein A2X25_04395 [Chloroflexi bacterium GWB2_49_20]OGN78619.1 MAG: hypothetical protein A2X26_12455 [Chloroflexi bacterium GWC2_49_37]OGN85721.1 MAG: hypothetical protein A2X27_00925 [Chloroflexi bacterium GWD2_49_16]HBG75053.1 hypothetical protein [Anaerolineae bacterium]HCC78079.1 hypothetical protein [Anaerolineae bacterium]
MDFFNIDPDLKRLPPKETRIISLDAKPYEDGRRVHIYLELTPFQQSPYIELNLTDSLGNDAGSASIIEPPRWKHELTMHIKSSKQNTVEFQLTARLFYPEKEEVDKRVVTFNIPINNPEE